MLKDLRYAWRGVVAKPGFSAAVVLTLGLGVGANIAMFGIVDRLLFRAPAYLSDADRVHRVYPSMLFNGELQTGVVLEYRRYEEVAGSTNAFDVAAAFATREMPVGTGERMRILSVTATSATLFDLFDARPVIGRFFTTAEDRVPEGEHVAVLSYNYWQTEFGGSRSALGQALLIGDAL